MAAFWSRFQGFQPTFRKGRKSLEKQKEKARLLAVQGWFLDPR